jgi:hypothetical protein
MAAIFLRASISLACMTSSRSLVFGIHAFDSKVRVESESEVMRDNLDRFLLPALARCEISREAADITITVQDASGGFEIFLDHVKVCSAEAPHDAALGAVKALDDALVRKLRKLRAVHAGAVVLNGRALLIPGSSHAGKSSLVAELLRRGAAHLSDEYALVDEEGRVHAYPRPLLLRNGSPRQTLVLPDDLDASFEMEPAEVGWIVAVDYDSEGSWKVEQISQGEAVMLLLRNTPHEMEQSPEMIELFTRSVAGAECYAGTRGDVAEAADRILELVAK